MKKCTFLCEHSDLGSCLRELTMCEVNTPHVHKHIDIYNAKAWIFFRIGYRQRDTFRSIPSSTHIKLTYLTYSFQFYIDLLQLLWFRPFISFFFPSLVVILFRFYLVAKTSIIYFLLPVIWFFLSFQFSRIFFHIFI